MTSYVVRRLVGAVPLLLGVATLLFFILHLAPGDPTVALFGPNASAGVIEQTRRNFGLDQPLHIQYVRWLGALLTGDFGISFEQGRPVADIIRGALPNTLILTGTALILMFVIGIAIGTVQAVRQYSATDNVLSVIALFFYSMPSFWLALMMMLVFSLKASQWGWPIAFPPTGITGVEYDFFSVGGKIVDRIMHMVLPVTTLTLALAAGVARYTRGQMLEIVRQDYIRTARAKGLPEKTVIARHALRNSLIPIITLIGLYLPFLFSGTVFVEAIFAWPGMGRVIYDGILQRDYPVVMATSFVFAALTILGSLAADVLYAVADPRIRYERS
jgi:peptide/nickel transport system permease protein